MISGVVIQELASEMVDLGKRRRHALRESTPRHSSAFSSSQRWRPGFQRAAPPPSMWWRRCGPS